jgi:hypothetical protein
MVGKNIHHIIDSERSSRVWMERLFKPRNSFTESSSGTRKTKKRGAIGTQCVEVGKIGS